jgi:hypothetical protein
MSNTSFEDIENEFGFGFTPNATNTGGLTLPALQGSGAGSFVAGNPLGFGTSGAADSTSPISGLANDPITEAGIASIAPAVANVAGGSLVAAAGGAPVTITNLPGADTAITSAGNSVKTGATTVGSDVTSSAGTIANTAASAISSLETYTSTTFVAVAIAIMGIIFVAFGLGLFGKKQIQQVVQTAAPIARAAKVL